MRKSRFDPFFFLLFLGLYYYYFFVVGMFKTTMYTPLGIPYESVAWHGGVLLAPMFATVFFFLYVFGDELEGFELKKTIGGGWRKLKVFVREGLEEYKKWRKNL